MFRLNFTKAVLRYSGSASLEGFETTQTIRRTNSEVVAALTTGGLKAGDQVEIYLDGKKLGDVAISDWDKVDGDLSPDDAIRGGFLNMLELRTALTLAGYRAKDQLWRIRFNWLEGVTA